MSLEYKSEEFPQTDLPEENPVQFQRAMPVFPYFTVTLIVSLIAVFICQLVADREGSTLGHGYISIIIAGFVKQFFNAGQYWRILTGASLHSGITHLVFNCYALYVLGKLIETLSNRAHLAIVFLLSAIGGGILSLIFLPDIPSVGASGGIIGFLGYLTVYGIKRRKLLPEGFLKNMLFNIGFIAFMGIFVIPNVDNFGHLGGLLVGLFYGLIQIPSDLYKNPQEVNSTTRFVGLAALGIFILTCLFSILLLLGIITIPFPNIPELIG